MATNPIEVVLGWADERPDAPAIVSPDVTITYRELADVVRRTAARLRQVGVRPGHVVAVRARPEWSAMLSLALLHEGAVSLHGSDAVLAAYGEHIDMVLGDQPARIPDTVRVVPVGAEFMASLGAANPRTEPRPLEESRACRVVFSSGTTGRPKGIEFTVGSLRARTDSARQHWMPHDPFMCLLGPDTVSGFQTFAWSALHGAAYLIPTDGAGNLRMLVTHGVRSIKTSPARLGDLLDAVESSDEPPPLALEEVQVAGSLMSGGLARRCERLLALTPVYLYGSTEAGTITRGAVDPDDPTRVGCLVPDARLAILDEDGTDITGTGRVGTIRFRTPPTPQHYWHVDEETDSSFDGGWFAPGDRGSVDDTGALRVSGRVDDLVNAAGAKISLAELDLWLSDLELFSECASFSWQMGDGSTAIGVAFVSSRETDPHQLRERVRRSLPSIDVRALVRVDALPRNDRGKVARGALAALVKGSS